MSETHIPERRRDDRLPIELSLEVSRVFKQDYVEIDGLDAKVEVCDISKSGIGFISKADLPLNYYFNGKLVLGEKDQFFYAVIQIVRKGEPKEEGYTYGAEFVGLAPFLANKVDQYAESLQKDDKYIKE